MMTAIGATSGVRKQVDHCFGPPGGDEGVAGRVAPGPQEQVVQGGRGRSMSSTSPLVVGTSRSVRRGAARFAIEHRTRPRLRDGFAQRRKVDHADRRSELVDERDEVAYRTPGECLGSIDGVDAQRRALVPWVSSCSSPITPSSG